jgi:SAM-dependent methyltransferase
MTSPDAHPPSRPAPDNSPASWDQRYTELDQVWSGQPNGALVAEVGSSPPGRALDVGCGEGADAVWLARRGWEVTALDVSEVALQRAEQAALAAGVAIRWVHAGLLEADLPSASFDLVSAQYPALLATPGHDAERALLSLVAPGGLLLVVHHAQSDVRHAQSQGFDPRDYVAPGDVAALLDDSWTLEVHETRPRSVTGGAGAHHREDVVVRARRLR